MTDLIVFAILAVIIAAAALYIYKEKKRGVKCIGCPAGASCSGQCSGAGSGGCHTDAE